jgi:hypothetical protein
MGGLACQEKSPGHSQGRETQLFFQMVNCYFKVMLCPELWCFKFSSLGFNVCKTFTDELKQLLLRHEFSLIIFLNFYVWKKKKKDLTELHFLCA